MVKDQIESVLSPLVGLPLWNSGRSANLQWFDFGSKISAITDSKGNEDRVGEFILDVQCAWHITSPTGIEVGSRDLLYPSDDDPYMNLEDFEWDHPGKNRCDERIQRLLDAHTKNQLVVLTISADNYGGIRIDFNQGYKLELFLDDLVGGEYWRFYDPVNKTPHFVFSESFRA